MTPDRDKLRQAVTTLEGKSARIEVLCGRGTLVFRRWQGLGDILGAIDEFNIEPLVHSPAGQGIGWFNEVKTVKEVMDALIAEAKETLASV